jgi:DNA-binding protein HU-beta
MNKAELIEAVMKEAGIEVKKQAGEAVDAVFGTITKVLGKGEEVAIAGFGTFKVAKRAARMGINPRTGEKIQIAASIKPKFRAGKVLKEAVQ